MIYLFNTNLHANKKVNTALQSIYGIGKKRSEQICHQLGMSHHTRITQLSPNQIEALSRLIDTQYQIGSDLSRLGVTRIDRLIQIGSYRGFRHIEGLPVRGQRTHGNAKTCRKLQKNRPRLIQKKKIQRDGSRRGKK